MQYQEVEPISEMEAAVALTSGTPEMICDALVRLVHHHSDWRQMQDLCIKLADSPNPEISGLAVTCLGHLARLHGQLDLEKVVPILKRLRTRSDIAGRVDDAMDDMKIYLHDKISL